MYLFQIDLPNFNKWTFLSIKTSRLIQIFHIFPTECIYSFQRSTTLNVWKAILWTYSSCTNCEITDRYFVPYNNISLSLSISLHLMGRRNVRPLCHLISTIGGRLLSLLDRSDGGNNKAHRRWINKSQGTLYLYYNMPGMCCHFTWRKFTTVAQPNKCHTFLANSLPTNPADLSTP